jgi:hypothetical protein
VGSAVPGRSPLPRSNRSTRYSSTPRGLWPGSCRELCRCACVFLDDITAGALDVFEREPLPLGSPCAA